MKKILVALFAFLTMTLVANAQCTTSSPCSMFAGLSPGGAGTDKPLELGVRFFSDQSGTINGIKFYKSSADTQTTHKVNLWSSTGTNLGSATSTSETGSGWQTVMFATPISITAGTNYVASYGSPAATFVFTRNAFTSQFNAAPLHAVADSTGTPDGPFVYTVGGFPNTSFSQTNYFVDVLFVGPPASTHSVSLAWTQGTVDGTACSGGGTDIVTANKIYRGLTSGGETLLAAITAGVAYTDPTVTASTTYFYRVSAVNCNGESGPSSEVLVTIPGNSGSVPNPPAGLSGTPH